MAKTLTFNAVALRPIVRWTRDHKPYSATIGDMLNPAYLKDGEVLGKDGFATIEQIDVSKIPASLLLVKDSGIYLMSSSKEREITSGEQSRVAYAEGFESKPTDTATRRGELFDKCVAAVGGDDFAEPLPLEWFLPVLFDMSIQSVKLTVSKGNIKLSYGRAAKSKAKA